MGFEKQSAFFHNRFITDNAFLSFEVFHAMKSWKIGFMTLNLDMSKACDRVEWNFASYGFSIKVEESHYAMCWFSLLLCLAQW